jgi:hypothetical protein
VNKRVLVSQGEGLKLVSVPYAPWRDGQGAARGRERRHAVVTRTAAQGLTEHGASAPTAVMRSTAARASATSRIGFEHALRVQT